MNSFKKLISFIQSEFDAEFKNISFPKEPEYLYEPIKYSILSKGKRFRPVMAHLSGRLFNADPNELIKVSIAVELLHNFTLIHDDIMDGDDTRRGRLSVYKKYNISSAILAGDGIFSLCQLILCGLNNNVSKVLTLFNKTALEICEGQGFDKQFELIENIEQDLYINMIEKKTGSLLGACASIPAVLTNQNSKTIHSLDNMGRYIGKAFQIQDDLLEIFGGEDIVGKSLGSDLKKKKKTLIFILANNINKRKWSSIVDDYDGNSLKDVRTFLIENNIKHLVENLMGDYFSLANKELLSLDIDLEKDELQKFIELIKNRNY